MPRWTQANALATFIALPVSLAIAASAGHRSKRARHSVVAIKGGTILTVTKRDDSERNVVLRDGKIAAVGANVSDSRRRRGVDAAGKFVSPGIIDCHSHIAADSINEGGTTVSSMTGIEDVFDPDRRRHLPRSRRRPDRRQRAARLRQPDRRQEHGDQAALGQAARGGLRCSKARCPASSSRSARTRSAAAAAPAAAGTPPRYPGTRMGVEEVIRDAFTRAKAYQKDWQDYDAPQESRRDVLRRGAICSSSRWSRFSKASGWCTRTRYRADEILMLLRVADEFGFKIATLQHVLEGYKVAKEIAAHGAGASTFSDWWAYKIEANDAIPYNAALMTRNGVLVSINSDERGACRGT